LSDIRFLTFGVLNNLCGGTLHNSHSRIGGSCKVYMWAYDQNFHRAVRAKLTQVNTNDWSPNLLIGIIWIFPNKWWTKWCAKKIYWSCSGRCSSGKLSKNHQTMEQIIRGKGDLQLLTILKLTFLQLLQRKGVSGRLVTRWGGIGNKRSDGLKKMSGWNVGEEIS